RHPRDAAPLNDLGLCYARQGKYGDSVEMFRRAVTLDPLKPLYRNNLATVLVELDRAPEAVEQLATVHNQSVALYNVGFLLNKRGQQAEALSYFERALESDPKFDAARAWVDTLRGELGDRSASATLPTTPAAPSAPAATSAPAAAPAAEP